MANNPALSDVDFIIGNWQIELFNASFLPDLKQKVSFTVRYDWQLDGSVIAVQQNSDDQSATWIIGRDESQERYTVLYSDSRGVSRVYLMTFKSDIWKMWRSNHKLSQRFEAKVSKDKKTIDAHWDKCTDGKNWLHDFDMRYSKK